MASTVQCFVFRIIKTGSSDPNGPENYIIVNGRESNLFLLQHETNNIKTRYVCRVGAFICFTLLRLNYFHPFFDANIFKSPTVRSD